jgi:hypothetical protein
MFLLFIITVLPFLMIDFRTAEAQTVFTDDFSTNSGAWQYLGSAYRDETDQQLILTTSTHHQGGVALFKAPIQGAFTASFRYKSTGGDGITMFFYKQNYTSIGDGGSLAFTTHDEKIVPGYGIEFDSWQNIPYDFQLYGNQTINPPQADPSSAHIALIEGYVGNHLTYVDNSKVEDDDWHQVTVEVQAAAVTVIVDQEIVLQWSGSFNRTYSGFGFSGANGSSTGWHIIDDVSISSEEIKKPDLTISCKGSTSFSDFNAQIDGNLTVEEKPISDAPILLRYSFDQGKSWKELTVINTNSEGYYTATWFPSVTGNYLIKASYEGSNQTLGTTSATVNFAVTNLETNTMFSVSSNSTVSELAFNSTVSQLSFTVTGPSGTTGYVECTLAKNLVANAENIQMFLDGNQLTYNLSSKADMWLLYFTYNHSTHRISINIPTNIPTNTNTNTASSTYEIWIATAAIITLTCTALAIYLKKHK